MSWKLNKQKLLCFMLVDDALGEKILGPSANGIAFWRAFIVEDRQTGEVSGFWRFKYPDGNRSWYSLKAKAGKTGDDAARFWRRRFLRGTALVE